MDPSSAPNVPRLNTARRRDPDSRYRVFGIIGAGNFLAFFVVSLFIGGSAILGEVGGNRYFLGNHGELHEVSFTIYCYSLVHALTQIITFPLACYGALMSQLTRLTED